MRIVKPAYSGTHLLGNQGWKRTVRSGSRASQFLFVNLGKDWGKRRSETRDKMVLRFQRIRQIIFRKDGKKYVRTRCRNSSEVNKKNAIFKEGHRLARIGELSSGEFTCSAHGRKEKLQLTF